MADLRETEYSIVMYSKSLQKHALTVSREHLVPGADRLDQVLAAWLPQVLGGPVSRGKVRKLIIAGAVYLNRKRVRIASKTLQAGARLEVFIDAEKLAQGGPLPDRVFRMTEAHVLFEDEFLIVVNKPAGLPTQPTLDEARDNLFAGVKRFLTERTRRAPGGAPYVGLHHRLDRDTSGVVLFTKKTEANGGVADVFSKHRALKVYQALVLPTDLTVPACEDIFSVENFLGKDSTSSGKRARFTAVRSGGDFAKTGFTVLERFSAGALLIEARPLTGRTHQIRVHLAGLNLPILGDAHYGGKASLEAAYKVPRMMLHAARLTFPHPIHNNEVTVNSPLPEDFNACLHRLRARAPTSVPTSRDF